MGAYRSGRTAQSGWFSRRSIGRNTFETKAICMALSSGCMTRTDQRAGKVKIFNNHGASDITWGPKRGASDEQIDQLHDANSKEVD
jgi:hypothetical protein